ncbi:MAG: sigma-70 family RNA polymerase sigma factor [bacterium]|nr:sigma-70 family RNA polymerase sigma factor [bacterium]
MSGKAEGTGALGERGFLERLRAGDEAAFEELIQIHQGPLYGFLLRMTGEPDDALDLVQETFIRALRSLSTFRGESTLKTWLHRIAMNLFLNEKRRPQRETVTPEELESQEPGFWDRLTGHVPEPDEVVESRQEMARLEKAILKLPEEYRSVLLLRDREGHTAQEVAELLEISVAAVKSRLHRARMFVRQEMLGTA